MMRVLDLFSGIGGFSLGLERTGGFKTVAFCEIDPFCRRVLPGTLPLISLCDPEKKTGGHAEVDRPFRGTCNMLNIADRPSERKAAKNAPVFSDAHVNEARRASAYIKDRIERSQFEIITEPVELTPVLAEILLDRNPENRPPSDLTVSRYATDIKSGNWSFNGESIKVSRDGLLNDGQHRCRAVIQAGRSIRTLIIFGVERSSRTTLDQGMARTPGHYLAMEGVPNANTVAAVASSLWQLEHLGRFSTSGAERPTKAQILAYIHERPEIIENIRSVPYGNNSVLGSRTFICLCHALLARVDQEGADVFIQRLLTGEELKRNDPIFVLRSRLLARGRLRPQEKLEIVIRAWNAHRRGRTLSSLPIHGRLPVLER